MEVVKELKSRKPQNSLCKDCAMYRACAKASRIDKSPVSCSVVVDYGGVRRYSRCNQRPIRPTNRYVIAHEINQGGTLTEFRSVPFNHSAAQKTLVHENHRGVQIHRQSHVLELLRLKLILDFSKHYNLLELRKYKKNSIQ